MRLLELIGLRRSRPTHKQKLEVLRYCADKTLRELARQGPFEASDELKRVGIYGITLDPETDVLEDLHYLQHLDPSHIPTISLRRTPPPRAIDEHAYHEGLRELGTEGFLDIDEESGRTRITKKGIAAIYTYDRDPGIDRLRTLYADRTLEDLRNDGHVRSSERLEGLEETLALSEDMYPGYAVLEMMPASGPHPAVYRAAFELYARGHITSPQHDSELTSIKNAVHRTQVTHKGIEAELGRAQTQLIEEFSDMKRGPFG